MHSSIAAQKASNITKTYMLMGVFLIIVIVLGWALSEYFGNSMILYGFVAFSVATNIFAYWFSDTVAVKSAGAIPADETQYRELHQSVEKLSHVAGIPKPRVYIINDPAPNAFATGRGPNNAVVAVTTGLMSMMSKDELEGVLAHELGHVQNRDILVMTIAVVLVGFISVMAQMAMHASAFGGDRDRSSGVFGVVILIAAMILAPLASQLMQMAVSRRREYLADATGAGITNHPYSLASALEKIGNYKAPMARASMTTAHLFISNPFGASAAGKYVSGFFATHPPIEERVKILRSM